MSRAVIVVVIDRIPRRQNGEILRDRDGVAYHDRVEARSVDRLAFRDGHRAHRAAMVRTLHADDILAAGECPRHFDARFDGLGARVPEEERVQRRVRHHGQQPFDELEVRLVKRDAALKDTVDLAVARWRADGG